MDMPAFSLWKHWKALAIYKSVCASTTARLEAKDYRPAPRALVLVLAQERKLQEPGESGRVGALVTVAQKPQSSPSLNWRTQSDTT